MRIGTKRRRANNYGKAARVLKVKLEKMGRDLDACHSNACDIANRADYSLDKLRSELGALRADINDALRIALNDNIEGMERERIELLADQRDAALKMTKREK